MENSDIIDYLPVLVYGLEYDPRLGPQTGRVTYCNMRTIDFIGYSEQEIIELGFDFYRNVLHPDDLHKTTKTIEAIISSGKKEHTELYRVKSKNGNRYSVMKGICLRISPIKKDLPIQFVVTTLYASPNEIHQLYAESDIIFDTLTKREKEIALLIAKGHSDKYIAETLFISSLTAKKHRANIRNKFKAKNTAELLTHLLSLEEALPNGKKQNISI